MSFPTHFWASPTSRPGARPCLGSLTWKPACLPACGQRHTCLTPGPLTPPHLT